MTVKVYIIESERGWGSKVDEVLEFPTKEEAQKYADHYNQKHNNFNGPVPDWYMIAQVQG